MSVSSFFEWGDQIAATWGWDKVDPCLPGMVTANMADQEARPRSDSFPVEMSRPWTSWNTMYASPSYPPLDDVRSVIGDKMIGRWMTTWEVTRD